MSVAQQESSTRRQPSARRWRRPSERVTGWLVLLAASISLLVAWQIAASWTAPLILPSPTSVASRLADFVSSGDVWPHLKVTAQEVALGFLLGSFCGIGLGTLAAESRIARRVVMPYVIVSQAIPKFALAPLLVIWFGFGVTPKVIIAALIAFFPLLENTFLGLTSTPPDLVELFRSLRASRWRILLRLRVPNAVPTVFSGLRVALVLTLVGAVVAEYVGANEGLGALIIVAQGVLDTQLMFVAIVVITLLALVLDGCYLLVYRLVMRRLYGRALTAGSDGAAAHLSERPPV